MFLCKVAELSCSGGQSISPAGTDHHSHPQLHKNTAAGGLKAPLLAPHVLTPSM
jgi:hypothetical protein